jgi:hypothetical protein
MDKASTGYTFKTLTRVNSVGCLSSKDRNLKNFIRKLSFGLTLLLLNILDKHNELGASIFFIYKKVDL